MSTVQVPAREVEEGHFLPGMGNGYVTEVESDPEVSFRSGRHYFHAGDGMVLITFHDQHGEENYLLLTADHAVTVATDEVR